MTVREEEGNDGSDHDQWPGSIELASGHATAINVAKAPIKGVQSSRQTAENEASLIHFNWGLVIETTGVNDGSSAP